MITLKCRYDWTGASKRTVIEAEEPNTKRLCKNTRNCIIHCTDDNTDLICPRDEESWQTLKNAAEIRNHQSLIEIAKNVSEGEIPEIYYHRKCRSVFTMKKLLDNMTRTTTNNDQGAMGRRLSIRGSPNTVSTVSTVCQIPTVT